MRNLEFSFIVPVAPGKPAEVVESIKNLDYSKGRYETIIEEGTNPSENRNNGVKRSSGGILIFVDDDAIIPVDLLNNVNNFFKKHPHIEIVGGPQLTPKDDLFFAKMSGYALSSFFGSFSMYRRYKKAKLDLNADEKSLTSAMCIVKSAVFDRIDGFDSNLYPGEDPEFFSRAKKNGIGMAYSPDLYVYHRRRPTYRLFLIQIFKYGSSRIKKEGLAGILNNPIFFLPTIFLIYLVILPFLVFASWIFLVPLIAYVFLAFIFSLPYIFKNALSIFMLPFLFFSIHIAYGIGVLAGIFRK